jgi:predicted Zn-dependent peptidase
MVTGESENPSLVRERVLDEIARQRKEGIDPAQFETCKKMMYGDAVADLESVERVASLLSSSHFRGRTPADELRAVAELTAQDVNGALQRMLNEERSAFFVVEPAGE